MKLIDTHTHIYSREFDNDREQVICAAKEAGIERVLLPNEDANSIDAINRLCDKEPDFAYPMAGLHPTSVGDNYVRELQIIEATLANRQYCAIGEIGIDLYWDNSRLKEQKAAFEEQLRWSVDLQLPVAIHTRESFAEVLDSIYNVGADHLRGVFHCFSGAMDEWNEIFKLSNFYVGIGGVVTFKSSVLSETLRHIPIERIVLETDAPYLAPVPYRGRRNEPRYIWEVAKQVAKCQNLTLKAVAISTSQNASNLFNI